MKYEVRSSSDTMLYNSESLSMNYNEHILCDINGKLNILYKNSNCKSDNEFYKFISLCHFYLGERIRKIIPISFNPNSIIDPLITYSYILIAESGWIGLFIKLKDLSVANTLKEMQRKY